MEVVEDVKWQCGLTILGVFKTPFCCRPVEFPIRFPSGSFRFFCALTVYIRQDYVLVEVSSRLVLS